jgi:hypothetical protein
MRLLMLVNLAWEDLCPTGYEIVPYQPTSDGIMDGIAKIAHKEKAQAI